jgi:hypothetical protein
MTNEEPLGLHAAQQVERTAALIELLGPKISNNESIETILKACEELNRTTWDLKNAIVRDLQERGRK